jgi:hypothetical protein
MSSTGGWDGDERRAQDDGPPDGERRGVTSDDDQVKQVATFMQARKFVEGETQKLLRRTKWRAGLAAFIAALVVSVIVSVALNSYLGDEARHNSLVNCNIQAAGRPLGNGRAFAQTQILEIADRAFEQFPMRFQRAEIARVNRELAKARPLLDPKAPRRVKDFSDLSKLLTLLPLLNCEQEIK